MWLPRFFGLLLFTCWGICLGSSIALFVPSSVFDDDDFDPDSIDFYAPQVSDGESDYDVELVPEEDEDTTLEVVQEATQPFRDAVQPIVNAVDSIDLSEEGVEETSNQLIDGARRIAKGARKIADGAVRLTAPVVGFGTALTAPLLKLGSKIAAPFAKIGSKFVKAGLVKTNLKHKFLKKKFLKVAKPALKKGAKKAGGAIPPLDPSHVARPLMMLGNAPRPVDRQGLSTIEASDPFDAYFDNLNKATERSLPNPEADDVLTSLNGIFSLVTPMNTEKFKADVRDKSAILMNADNKFLQIFKRSSDAERKTLKRIFNEPKSLDDPKVIAYILNTSGIIVVNEEYKFVDSYTHPMVADIDMVISGVLVLVNKRGETVGIVDKNSLDLDEDILEDLDDDSLAALSELTEDELEEHLVIDVPTAAYVAENAEAVVEDEDRREGESILSDEKLVQTENEKLNDENEQVLDEVPDKLQLEDEEVQILDDPSLLEDTRDTRRRRAAISAGSDLIITRVRRNIVSMGGEDPQKLENLQFGPHKIDLPIEDSLKTAKTPDESQDDTRMKVESQDPKPTEQNPVVNISSREPESFKSEVPISKMDTGTSAPEFVAANTSQPTSQSTTNTSKPQDTTPSEGKGSEVTMDGVSKPIATAIPLESPSRESSRMPQSLLEQTRKVEVDVNLDKGSCGRREQISKPCQSELVGFKSSMCHRLEEYSVVICDDGTDTEACSATKAELKGLIGACVKPTRNTSPILENLCTMAVQPIPNKQNLDCKSHHFRFFVSLNTAQFCWDYLESLMLDQMESPPFNPVSYVHSSAVKD